MPAKPFESDITRCNIDDAALLAIGRLVRACAEIEDITILHICNLASISEAKGLTMLGRAPMRTLKAVALQLATLHSEAALAAHKSIYTNELEKLLKLRNIVAHGAFLGKDEEGNFVFLSADTDETGVNFCAKVAYGYSTTHLEANSQAAENILPMMEDTLRLRSLRERSYSSRLPERRRGQTQRNTKAER